MTTVTEQRKCKWLFWYFHNWKEYGIYLKTKQTGDKEAEAHGGVLRTFEETWIREKCKKCGIKREIMEKRTIQTERWT